MTPVVITNKMVNAVLLMKSPESKARILGDVSLDVTNSYINSGQSLKVESGHMLIEDSDVPFYSNNFFFNIRFNAKDTNGTKYLVTKGSGSDTEFSLYLDGDDLIGTIKTSDGEFSTRIDNLVQEDRWYIAGLRLRGGRIGSRSERC